MPSKIYLMLRSAQRARLEARTTSMQPSSAGFDKSFTSSQKGIDGSRGGDGSAGTELNLNVQTLIATDGSLWIKTDVPLAVPAVRAAMDRRALARALAEHIVTTEDLGVMAAAEETESMVATPHE
jgi:hypothetical protein